MEIPCPLMTRVRFRFIFCSYGDIIGSKEEQNPSCNRLLGPVLVECSFPAFSIQKSRNRDRIITADWFSKYSDMNISQMSGKRSWPNTYESWSWFFRDRENRMHKMFKIFQQFRQESPPQNRSYKDPQQTMRKPRL